MIKKVNTLILLLSLFSISIKAQTVPSPTEAYINMELLNPETLPDEVLDTLLNPMSILSATDTLKISVTMLLADTNVVNKIHIKLGTTSGGNDLLAQTFNYDDYNITLPQSFFREAEMITLGLGEYLNSGVFYCEIILEDSVGNTSVVFNCQSDQ